MDSELEVGKGAGLARRAWGSRREAQKGPGDWPVSSMESWALAVFLQRTHPCCLPWAVCLLLGTPLQVGEMVCQKAIISGVELAYLDSPWCL